MLLLENYRKSDYLVKLESYLNCLVLMAELEVLVIFK